MKAINCTLGISVEKRTLSPLPFSFQHLADSALQKYIGKLYINLGLAHRAVKLLNCTSTITTFRPYINPVLSEDVPFLLPSARSQCESDSIGAIYFGITLV